MASISRRGFVTGSLAAAAVLKYGLPAFAKEGGAASGIVDIKGSDPKQMVADVIKGLFGDKFGNVVSGKRVVLKANAGFANPAEWATTTNPAVVAAVAQQCKDAGAKTITLVEFPQGDAGVKCFDRCGMRAALEPIGVKLKLLDPNKDFELPTEGKMPGGSLENKGLMFSSTCKSADVLINIPVAKSHADTGVSFGLKNFMGLIKDRRAFHDADINRCIADLAAYVQLVATPSFTLLDATRVLKTGGPQGPGEVVQEGRLIAGVMTASVDAYALEKLDITGKGKASHIKLAVALMGASGGREKKK
jgi:uncharacterized protein (DUF362 family)